MSTSLTSQKYRVVGYPNIETCWAVELRDTFGLHHLTIRKIQQVWCPYSHQHSVQWLAPTRARVEEAFGVLLEEIP